MNQPTLPKGALPPRTKRAHQVKSSSVSQTSRRRKNKRNQKSDVLISAVISSYLLTHLHHVLQRAEYIAVKDGRANQAANLAQLRKLLCMDARSMEDAYAAGKTEADFESKVA